MPIYERYSGQHVAERVKAPTGSGEDKRLAGLAEAGQDGWREAKAPEAPVDPSKRPAKSAPKAPWAAWAVHVHGYSVEDADAMTLAELKELPDAPEGNGEPDEDGGE